MLDMAFEEAGHCVVRAEAQEMQIPICFHPPARRFNGVIGGPPCQRFSKLAHIVKAKGQELAPNLIPEYERVVSEAEPDWFLMENVPDAPDPIVARYFVAREMLQDSWVGGATSRLRKFCFGHRDPAVTHTWRKALQTQMHAVTVENPERTVVAQSSKEGALAKSQGELKTGVSARLKREAGVLPGQKPRRAFEHCCELQGLPRDFLEDSPFTSAGKYLVVGNGVPLPMGRAVAAAIATAIKLERAA